MLAEHDQIGALVACGPDDLGARVAGRPRELGLEPGGPHRLLGVVERSLDIRRRLDRHHHRPAVVKRPVVLDPLGVERHLGDDEDDEARTPTLGLLDRVLERPLRRLLVVVAHENRLSRHTSPSLSFRGFRYT